MTVAAPGSAGSRRRRARLRLRSRIALGFAVLTLVTSLAMAGTVWLLAVRYVEQQRVDSERAQATDNAKLLDSQLKAGLTPGNDLLERLRYGPGTGAVLVSGTTLYRNVDAAALTLPADLTSGIPPGVTVLRRITVEGLPYDMAARRLSGHDRVYAELLPLADLRHTVTSTGWMLVAVALMTSCLGGATGWIASRLMLRPVHDINRAAAAIAHGDLSARLAPRGDPDLDALAESFNRTAADLEERVQADARFAGDVSHELRTPLTTMLNSLALVRNRSRLLPPDVAEPLDLLTEDLHRFRRLVVDLLEISRLDEGEDDSHREPVVVAELVRRAADAAAGRPVTRVAPGASHLVLQLDKRRMERVVTNLVENAARHGRRCSEVLVEAPHDVVRIAVRDDGPGVAADLRGRIFERFARAPAGPDQAPGAGLGLAIAERHVRLHGGRIWVQDAPGGGAEFVVELPRRPVPTQRG